MSMIEREENMIDNDDESSQKPTNNQTNAVKLSQAAEAHFLSFFRCCAERLSRGDQVQAIWIDSQDLTG